jgi:hypothetical protein
MRRDPIMNRYKPGTPTYEALAKLASPPRFAVMLICSILFTAALADFVIHDIQSYMAAGTSDAHFILWFGPIVALGILGTAFVVAYLLFLKN